MKYHFLDVFRNSKLNKKITYVTFGTFLMAFFVCFIIIVFFFSAREKEQAEKNLTAAYDRIQYSIENYMDEIDMSAYTVMFSNWVQNLLASDTFTADSSVDRTLQKHASHFLTNYSSIYGDIHYILLSEDQFYIMNTTNSRITQGFDIRKQDWYEELIEQKRYREYENASIMAKVTDKDALTTYYRIHNIYNLREAMGYFVVSLPYEQFSLVSEMIGENEDVLIQTASGKTVYCSMEDTEDFIQRLPEQKDTVSVKKNVMSYEGTVMDGQWKIWIIKESPSMMNSMKNHYYIFLIILPVILMCIFISIMFSKYLSRPIMRLTNAMQEVGRQNFEVRVTGRYEDEIGDMLRGFNDMTERITNLIEQNRLIYEAHQKAELQILQQRMDPHFLCNTLEIINGMILCGENDQAIELSGMIGKMYRYDLGEEDIVSVREEVSYLKNYLDILAYKYRRLQVHYQIDEEVLNYPLMKFICQPLAENALKHGFIHKSSECVLEIAIKREGSYLFIQIKDNGKGIEEELLKELQEKTELLRKNQDIEINTYIGVLNTAQRIFLQYGSESQFQITSATGKGTQIEISIPIRNEVGECIQYV